MILPADTDTSGRTPRRRNSRTASRAHRKAPRRLTFITASHCATLISWKGAFFSMPALLARMSTVPNSCTAAANMACTCASSETSACDDHRAGARGADFRGHGLGLLGLGHVVDHHVGAGPAQRQRDGAADAGVGAGDQRRLALQQRQVLQRRQHRLRQVHVLVVALHGRPRAFGWASAALRAWLRTSCRRPASALKAAASAPGVSSSSLVSSALVWMMRATQPVQPVWWLAPMPAPLSPWKYS